MKKWIILLIMILLPYQVFANQCDNDEVKIESVTLEEITDSAAEKSPAEINNNVIKLNLHMGAVNDYATYKVKIKNSSNEDFEFNANNLSGSEYLKYTITANDGSHTIAPGTEKVFTLKVEYTSKVPSTMLDDGEYQDNQTIPLKINTKVANPKTGRKIIIYLAVILIILSELIMLLFAKKKNKGLIMILIALCLIPTYVYAECQLDFQLDAKVTLANYYYVYTANVYNADDKPNTTIYIGDKISSRITLYKTPEEAMEALSQATGRRNRIFFLRHKIENERVTESYVGFVWNREINYIRGGVDETNSSRPTTIIDNVSTLDHAFGQNNCGPYDDAYRCSYNGISARIYPNGYVYVRDDEVFCHVRYDERSTCGYI